ncbi:MAG: InlB B-repeat-containing protein [Bacteroidales bacterium]|nr:InlB B-repeat-containing protein [Bacteroidales bacterium]
MKKFFAMMILFLLTSFFFISCGDDDEKEPEKVAEYTIKYDSNGGTGTIANTIYKIGDKITLADGSGFSRDGYTFAGWSTSPSGTSVDETAFNGKDVTLYAVWKKNEEQPTPKPDPEPEPVQPTTATITIELDGGAWGEAGLGTSFAIPVGKDILAVDGEDAPAYAKAIPVKDGYTFKGWSNERGGNVLTSLKAEQNVTIYAVWEQNAAEIVEVTASFAAAPESQMQPSMSVNIYAEQVQGDEISYSWDFGDGKTENWATNSEFNGETFVHTYETYGEYTITLTVKSKDNSAEAKQTITILPAPPTLVLPSTKYESSPYPLTLQLAQGVMYHDAIIWDINKVTDGTPTSIAKLTAPAGDKQESYTFDTPGLYYIYVYATGPGAKGELLMRTDTVEVTGASVPPEEEETTFAAFFPKGKEASNVAAWYAATTISEVKIVIDAAFLFNDGSVTVTKNTLADGKEKKEEVITLQYWFDGTSDFDNATINVGMVKGMPLASAEIKNGVLSVALVPGAEFQKQDNANIPAPSDPTN